MSRQRTRYRPQLRNFSTPEDLRDETFLDAFIDAFTPPDDLMLTQPDNGFMARIRDGHRIGAYFREAVTELGLEDRAQQ